MLNRIEDDYYYIKNEILNKVIQFCVNHCSLYTTTLYSVARRTHKYRFDFIYEQLKKIKE